MSKINSRWIKDLNVKDGTIKLSEDNIEVHFYDLEIKKKIVVKYVSVFKILIRENIISLTIKISSVHQKAPQSKNTSYK